MMVMKIIKWYKPFPAYRGTPGWHHNIPESPPPLSVLQLLSEYIHLHTHNISCDIQRRINSFYINSYDIINISASYLCKTHMKNLVLQTSLWSSGLILATVLQLIQQCRRAATHKNICRHIQLIWQFAPCNLHTVCSLKVESRRKLFILSSLHVHACIIPRLPTKSVSIG